MGKWPRTGRKCTGVSTYSKSRVKLTYGKSLLQWKKNKQTIENMLTIVEYKLNVCPYSHETYVNSKLSKSAPVEDKPVIGYHNTDHKIYDSRHTYHTYNHNHAQSNQVL